MSSFWIRPFLSSCLLPLSICKPHIMIIHTSITLLLIGQRMDQSSSISWTIIAEKKGKDTITFTAIYVDETPHLYTQAHKTKQKMHPTAPYCWSCLWSEKETCQQFAQSALAIFTVSDKSVQSSRAGGQQGSLTWNNRRIVTDMCALAWPVLTVFGYNVCYNELT